MAILSLLAKLGLDKTGFDNGMTAAGNSVKAFGKSLAGAFGATAVAAAAAQALRATIRYADEIDELSERLGTSAQKSQEWALAAKLNGEQADFVAANFQKMEKALNDANLGDPKSQRSLVALGISLEEIKRIGVEAAMRRAAEAINTTGNEAEKSAASIDIFGKSANKMKVVAQDLGTTGALGHLFPTDAEVKNVKAAADALDAIKTVLTGMAVSKLSPGGLLETIIGDMTDGLSKLPYIGSAVKALGDALNRRIAGPKKTEEEIGASIEAFRRMERMRKVAEEIGKVQKDLGDRGLTDEQKRVKLTEERLAIMQRIADIEAPGPKNPEARQKAILDLLKNEAAIVALPEGKDEAEKAARVAGFAAEHTKLGAIGGTLGSTGTRQEQVQGETLRQIKELREDVIRRGILVKGWR